MSDATRIISRFRQLLDVQVSRASAVWQRLNADGTVTDRTAADMRVDLGLGNSATLNTGTTSGTVATGNHSHAAVTTSVNGFMSAADKTKLNGISGTNTGDQDLTAYQLQPSEGPFVNGDKTKLDALPALAVENLIGTTSGGIVTTLVNAGEHVTLSIGGILIDSSTGAINSLTSISGTFIVQSGASTFFAHTDRSDGIPDETAPSKTETDASTYGITASDYGKRLRCDNTAGTEIQIPAGIGIVGRYFMIRRTAAAGPLIFENAVGVTVAGSSKISDVGADMECAIVATGLNTYDFI